MSESIFHVAIHLRRPVQTSQERRIMKRCLVIDDSSVIRKVAHTLLNSLGYEVIEATSEELEQLRAGQYAIPYMGK